MSDTAQPTTWEDRIAKQSIGIRQAERLMGAQGSDRRGRLVERLVRKTQDGTLGTATAEDPGGEEVIQVGDNHYTVLPAEPPAASSGLGKTLAATAAALLVGGSGVGGAMWALQPTTPVADPPAAIAAPDPGQTAAQTAADSDTRYRLQLVD